MSDIVERLREKTVTPYLNGIHSELQIKEPTELELEAADTIEALRAENAKLRAELETYTGSRAIVDRFPHHTRIRIFDRQEDADDRRRF